MKLGQTINRKDISAGTMCDGIECAVGDTHTLLTLTKDGQPLATLVWPREEAEKLARSLLTRSVVGDIQ
jgi:hypothetical protein